MDIAHIANGYVYHTKYDQPKFIPSGCLQRAGKILAKVVKMRNFDYKTYSQIKKDDDDDDDDDDDVKFDHLFLSYLL